MITVQRTLFDQKVAQVAKELKYVSSETFLQGLALTQREKEALSFLKSIFPHSLGKSSHNTNEFGMHLWSGWESSHFVDGAKVGFTIYHQLEGNQRAETVLKALDKGSKGWTWEVPETVRFLGDASHPSMKSRGKSLKESLLWVTLSEGRMVYRSPREGIHYTDKTLAFIRSVIMPELEADITHKIESRMARI